MSAAVRAQIAHCAAQKAIAEIMRSDRTLTRDGAATLLAHAAFADIRGTRGSEAASEAAYAIGDAFVGTPG